MKNLHLAFLGILMLLSFAAMAQYDVSRINKKAVESYNRGIEKAQAEQYQEAIQLLNDAVKKDPAYIDAYLSLAGIYGQLKQAEKSTEMYETAFAKDASYAFDFLLPYSINLARQGKFDKAYDAVDKLLTKTTLGSSTRKAAEYRKKTYAFALQQARETKPFHFTPENLGDAINSPESEYFPTMPIEGGSLVFTRRLNNRNEDFFAASRAGNDWKKAVRLAGDINTPDNEGAQNISQDGNWLVFTGCQRPDGYGSCDLYISFLTNSGWSEAVNMGGTINSEFWDSQPCLSPDKRQIYFTSNRPGGYGGSDIYVSNLQPNGRWGKPENLGPEINTAGDEACPFIHADNQTFYFTSNGLPGYGSYDIFVARRDEKGNWHAPKNLGYPINTIDEEGSLFITADGSTAYFASDRSDSRGGLDIYKFEMPEALRPVKTLWVKGKVFDAKTRQGLPSSVELIDLANRNVVSRIQTDETGHYLVTLPLGRDYAFNVNRRDYLFYSDNFPLRDKAPDSTYEKNIPLQPLEANATVVLRNIFFDVSKWDLKPESQAELDRVVELLQQNPGLKIQIGGHTDDVGSDADNQKLSEQRARSVVAYLVSKGIGANRLTAKGYGESKPVAGNDSEEGRAQNRRTEMMIISR